MGKLFAILAFAALQACSTSSVLAPPPSEDVRIQMRGVRIADLPALPEVRLDTPVKGWLAGIPAGACDVAQALMDVGSDPSADQAAMIALLAPLGLVIGAVYGPFVALPAETVERDEKVLREVLAQAGSGFASRVEAAGQKACPSRIVREGEDGVLHVGPATLSLTGPGWLDPFSTPRIDLRVRLIRSDGKVLYEGVIRHSGRPREFTQWAGSPNGLRDYFNRALDEIAERIVDEVFFTVPPPEPE